MNYADKLEERVAYLLTSLNIRFVHESTKQDQRLDFYLPDFDIYLEVKRFHTHRVTDQLSLVDNVLLIQGRRTLLFLEQILTMKNTALHPQPQPQPGHQHQHS